MAWLRVTRSGTPDQEHRIRGAQVTIGRGDCDLRLRDSQVSRLHCHIVVEGRHFLLVDRSRLGTLLNGQRVEAEQPVRVTPRDVVTIGPFELRLRLTVDEADRTTRKPAQIPLLVGHSPAMKHLQRQIFRAAQVDTPVLIRGETGTGKSLVARVLHQVSPRGALVTVNSAALAGPLVESELFGHEQGAFTGATTRRDGLFQHADGGTLLFDEIGDLPLPQQPKLLCVLEDRTVRRVGGATADPIDVRIVAATHRDLARDVTQGRFRADLYHRLHGIELVLPPLRDRQEDIPALAQALLDKDHAGLTLTDRALARLQRQAWPGNVRELRQALSRAAARTDGATAIDVRHFTEERPNAAPTPTREEVAEALASTTGERPAAHKLGIKRSKLRRLRKQYGLLPATSAAVDGPM